MKECKKVQELIPLYIFGECQVEERKKVENHIQTCSNCKEYYNYVIKLHKSFETEENLFVPEIGPEIVYNVNSQIDRYRKKKKFFKIMLPSFVSMLVLVLIAAFSLYNITSREQSQLNEVELLQTFGLFSEINDYPIYENLADTDPAIVDNLINTIELKKEYVIYEFQNAPEIDIDTILSTMTENEFEDFVNVLYASSL